jgi:hypothetical protein
MKPPTRRSFSLLFYSLLVLVVSTSAAQGQVTPARQGAEVATIPPVDHHVVGRLEKLATCNEHSGLRLQLLEFWLVSNSEAEGNLTRPSRTLFTRSGQLRQGRVLGEVALGNMNTDFDIQWLEAASFPRVPWVKAEDEPSHQVTAYRVLSLRVVGNTPNLFFTLNPKPIVTLFTKETRKDVGTVKLDCFVTN